MAKAASTNVVQADMRPADFRGAVQLIRSTYPKKEKIQGINGEIGDAYAKIEGKKVHRQAAKVWARMDKMEPSERADFMRSLNGLMDASEWPEETADMVDQAENNVVPMRLGQNDDAGDEEEDGEGDEDEAASQPAADRELGADDFEESSEEELAKQKGRAESKEAKELREKLDAAKGETEKA